MAIKYTPYSLLNYLVPADGTTHAITANFVASNVETLIDWQSVSTQFQTPFVPQGVYVDARGSSVDVVLRIAPIGISIAVVAGTIQSFSYPASKQNQQIYVTGQGTVVATFVDYPVLPSTLYRPNSLSQSVTVTNDPLNTQPTSMASGGVPYQTINQPFLPDGNSQAVNATTAASAQITLASGDTSVRIANVGTVPVYVAIGATGISAAIPVSGAPRNAFPIMPQSSESFSYAAPNNFLSTITSAGTATIIATTGTGT